MEVMKNIYSFANILSAANTELVKSWDSSSVTNALKWANYCMAIEKQTRNSSIRGDLDRQIQLMTVYLNPVSLRDLTADKLCESEHILCVSLMQNPYTPEDVLSTLADTIGCSTEKDISDLQRNKALSGYRIYQLLGEDVSYMEQSDKSQACHIMSRLVKLQKMCSFSQHRYDSFLEKIVIELQNYKNGFNVLIYMFMMDVVCGQDHNIIMAMKKTMLSTIAVLVGTGNCGLWTCSCSLLSEASSCDDGFADIYTELLMLWAQKMVPVYDVQGNGDIYFWRHKDSQVSNGYSYSTLQNHVIGLFQNPGKGRRKIQTKLEANSILSYFNIYKDLLRDCNNSIKKQSINTL